MYIYTLPVTNNAINPKEREYGTGRQAGSGAWGGAVPLLRGAVEVSTDDMFRHRRAPRCDRHHHRVVRVPAGRAHLALLLGFDASTELLLL